MGTQGFLVNETQGERTTTPLHSSQIMLVKCTAVAVQHNAHAHAHALWTPKRGGRYRNGRRHGRHGLLLHRPRERGGGEGGREFVGIHLAIYTSERVLPKSKRSDRGNEPTPRGRLTLHAEPKKRRSARPRRCLQAPRQVSLPRSNGAAGSTWLSAKRGLKTSRTRSRVR